VTRRLDATDYQIIRALENNGRQPNTEIALALGLSESAVRKRIDRLLEDGTVRIVGVSDPLKTGHDVIAIILMKGMPNKVDAIAGELDSFDEFRFIGHTIGSLDFVGEAWFESLADLYEFLSQRLATIDGLTEITPLTVHRMIRYAYDWGVSDGSNARARRG
jgi:Lrp/AsnC family transcriptional regulator, regulator for asnA, asnC and gidA